MVNPLISQETVKSLLSTLVGSSVIFDGQHAAAVLGAADYDIEMVGEALSLAQKNNSADDFHNIFRLALTADAWRKMGDKLQEKSPGKNLFTHIAALRSDAASSGSITGSVAYFPGGIHQKLSATLANVTLHAVLSGVVCVNDTAAVAAQNSGRLVGAGSHTTGKVTLLQNTDVYADNQLSVKNTAKYVGNVTQCNAIQSAEPNAENNKVIVKNLINLTTVYGARQIASMPNYCKVPYNLGSNTAEHNNVFGYRNRTDAALAPPVTAAPGAPAYLSTINSAYTVVQRQNAGKPTEKANQAGIAGMGWFVSCWSNPTDDATTADWAGAAGWAVDTRYAALKAKLESSNTFGASDYYSGFADEAAILGLLSKDTWDAEKLTTLGLTYQAIVSNGWSAQLADFKDSNTPHNFLTNVLGYEHDSGNNTYEINGVEQSYSSIFQQLKNAGYTSHDIINDTNSKAAAQAYNTVAGDGFTALTNVFGADSFTLVERITRLDSYTGVQLILPYSSYDSGVGGARADLGPKYAAPAMEVLKGLTFEQIVDLCVALDNHMTTSNVIKATLTPSSKFPNASSQQRDRIRASVATLSGLGQNDQSTFLFLCHNAAMSNDRAGTIRAMTDYMKFVGPMSDAQYNVKTAGEVEFVSCLSDIDPAATRLPPDEVYAIMASQYQDELHEFGGKGKSYDGSSWENYRKSASGNMPHQIYNQFLNQCGMGGVCKAGFAIPATASAGTWVAYDEAQAADNAKNRFADTLANHGDNTTKIFTWPNNVAAANNPFGYTIGTETVAGTPDAIAANDGMRLRANELYNREPASEFNNSGDCTEFEAAANFHLVTSSAGYGVDVATLIGSDFMESQITSVDGGYLLWAGDLSDRKTAIVLNILNALSFNGGETRTELAKAVINLAPDDVAEVFAEAAAARATGSAVLSTTQRNSVISAVLNMPGDLGNKLITIFKDSDKDERAVAAATAIVTHFTSIGIGLNVSTNLYGAASILGANRLVQTMKLHLLDNPGAIYTQSQDSSTVTNVNQRSNLGVIIVAAMMEMSMDDFKKVVAGFQKWNALPGMGDNLMVYVSELKQHFVPAYADVDDNGVFHTSGHRWFSKEKSDYLMKELAPGY